MTSQVDFSSFFAEARKKAQSSARKADSKKAMKKKPSLRDSVPSLQASVSKDQGQAGLMSSAVRSSTPACSSSVSSRRKAKRKLKMQKLKLSSTQPEPVFGVHEKQEHSKHWTLPTESKPTDAAIRSTKRTQTIVQKRLESQLAGGRFRFINELLYTRPVSYTHLTLPTKA